MSTHRKANVAVHNGTGTNLVSIAVAHKYSNEYKNQYTWEDVAANSTTGADLEVDYNTGFLTTGRDWWMITAVDDAGRVYISNPHNFREILDVLEKVTKDVLQMLPPIGSNPGVAAAQKVTTAILDHMLNYEDTAGFKQHILREDDEGRTVTITLRSLPSSGEAGDAVEIASPSGSSETNLLLYRG